MSIFILSDLHLQDEDEPYLFNSVKEEAFCRLAQEVLSDSEGHLLFAGDVFDLTGMTRPRHGMEAFFRELLPERSLTEPRISRSLRHRGLLEILQAARARFPKFFSSIAELAGEGKLTIIPGNHDCQLQATKAQRLLAKILEKPEKAIRWKPWVEVGDFLIAAHGNEFDPSNQTVHGCHNPGSVITSSLYQAVMPALEAMGVPKNIVHAIPAVRPEEEIVLGIQHYLSEEQTRKVLIAFARLLARNGYFRGKGLIAYPMWFLARGIPVISALVREFVTPERIRRQLQDDSHIKERARAGAEEIRARELLRTGSAAQIVVLGHTHELDFSPNYVNLGTWIDHIRGLMPEDLLEADRSLPVLAIEDGRKAILHDAYGLLAGKSLKNCPKFWST